MPLDGISSCYIGSEFEHPRSRGSPNRLSELADEQFNPDRDQKSPRFIGDSKCLGASSHCLPGSMGSPSVESRYGPWFLAQELERGHRSLHLFSPRMSRNVLGFG
ncbi:RING-type domain-containing protein [Psidium guajava]|nr:RING-type domain-containing protein [Psidium guajava]